MSNIGVESFKTFSDSSGAPAVITCDGFRFSCDLVGSAVYHNLSQGGRSPSKKVVRLVQWKYEQLIAALPAGYVEANKALYTETPEYV